jgi:hypothetical protein
MALIKFDGIIFKSSMVMEFDIIHAVKRVNENRVKRLL